MIDCTEIHFTGRYFKVYEHILYDGMYGLAVGDALGVPYESCSLDEMRTDPCTGMIGYRHHNQPPGSWSDDTSMSICIADSLCKGFDPDDMMKKFLQWKNHSQYTAAGKVFDVGRTTRIALNKYSEGFPAEYCGDASIGGNGNGGLMRTFPIAFYQCITCQVDDEHLDQFLTSIHVASRLTHAHEIGLICCGLFALTLREWMFYRNPSANLLDIAASAFQKSKKTYSMMGGTFSESINNPELFQEPHSLMNKKAEELPSWGYALNSWNIALWSLLTTHNYKECVLKAVNVGGDTDSNAAVAGALAGIIYGRESIPAEWMNSLLNRALIDQICGKLNRKLFGISGEKRVIDRFEGEYAFMAMKAPADIVIDGYLYSNVASAFYALGIPEAYRGQFSWTNAKQARKAYKNLPHLSEQEASLEKRLYQAIKVRYEQNEKDRKKLTDTGGMNIIYDTTGSHDNVLGRCRCRECKKKEHQNLYGKVLMKVREELR